MDSAKRLLPMPSRIITLRFRDIERNKGDTIREHRRMIDSVGHCWWGWLFKDIELSPHRELAAIDKDLRSTGDPSYAVVLYHTGLGRIYQATCAELVVAGTPIRSPQVEFTPNYYRDKRAPAWFKLTAIEDVDVGVLVGRTCVSMPSASEDCFTDLVGQKIKKVNDLRRQEVTLWILS